MDGVLLVNKPAGCTSHDVCQRVKRKLKAAKVGHTGTLDPMATGVLPLCINGATRLVQFLMFGEKEYAGRMRLGMETDTQDIEGAVLSTCDAALAGPACTGRCLRSVQGRHTADAAHVFGNQARWRAAVPFGAGGQNRGA